MLLQLFTFRWPIYDVVESQLNQKLCAAKFSNLFKKRAHIRLDLVP